MDHNAHVVLVEGCETFSSPNHPIHILYPMYVGTQLKGSIDIYTLAMGMNAYKCGDICTSMIHVTVVLTLLSLNISLRFHGPIYLET